ncbi:MAG: polysaccharide biosynthesis protein, partial [Salinimicrobium sp.]
YEELLSDKSKTLPTHHKKIMIAVDHPGNYEEVNLSIEKIIKSATKFKSHKVVAKLKKLVPEFKSNNSTFERLDSHSVIPDERKKII